MKPTSSPPPSKSWSIAGPPTNSEYCTWYGKFRSWPPSDKIVERFFSCSPTRRTVPGGIDPGATVRPAADAIPVH